MKVQNNKIVTLYQIAEKASVEQIKALSQTERKALKVMLQNLKNNGENANNELNETTFTSIQQKLTTEQTRQPSSLIMRIMKGVMNFFGWRISSKQLIDDISFIKKYGSEEKYAAIKSAQAEARQAVKNINSKYKSDQIKEWISRKEDIEELENGHVSQFVKDYKRSGIVPKISDPAKGVFQGKGFNPEASSKNDHLNFNIEGISMIFDPEKEKKWMRLAEVNIVQTPYNAMGHPLATSLLTNDKGEFRTFKVGNKEYNFNLNLNTDPIRIGRVNVKRDKHGEIEKLEISNTMVTRLTLIPEDILIGYIKSTTTFSVSYAEDGKTPIIKNLVYKHAFSECEPTIESTREPGFHSVKIQSPPTPETNAGKLIEGWKKELSEIKLSLKPTSEKVKRLDARIKDMKVARDKPLLLQPSLDEKFEMDLIIGKFESYYQEILKTS